MRTREMIDIPGHPDIDGVTRKAQVTNGYNGYKDNRVVIPIDIFHYIDGVELNYFPKKVELIADNNGYVNPQTGAIVEKDVNGNYPVGSVGEYDYLWDVVNVYKAKTQAELEDLYVNLRIDVINRKLYS